MAALSQRRSRLVRRLHRRKTREREGLVLVEGVRAAREALAAGAQVLFGVVSERLQTVAEGPALAGELATAGVDPERIGDVELADLGDTENPQGVLLVCAEPETPIDRLKRAGRYLVLDAVQDPGNVGTLVRSAAAFGLDAVVALDGTADPWGVKAVRASAGQAFRLPIVTAGCADGLAALGSAGVPLLVADPEGSDVRDVDGVEEGFALTLGNEGAGVRDQVREASDGAVGVPMQGPVESLNVAVAGSLLLYLLIREKRRGS